MTLRIGYIYDLQAYPPRGGNHRHAFELVQGFLKQGHDVSVVCDPTMPGVTNYSNSKLDLEQFINNIDVLYVRIDARLTRKWDTINVCIYLATDIPIVWEINSPSEENLAYSWLGGISQNNDYNDDSKLQKVKRWFHALRQKPSIWLEEKHRRKLSEKVSSAICVSSAVGKYAADTLGIENILILPNGGPIITEEEIVQRRKRRADNEFTVLYSGSAIYPWQGINYLSAVIEIAKKEAPDIRFVLAVNQSTPNLPASENVIIKEGLDQEQVRDAVCAADVCVALIPEWWWAKFGFHGSPTKLFEYMALMTPVLTSNHGQMQDIINDGIDGVLCNNEPKDILEKLIYLRDNPEYAKSIGRKGWERIQSEFNWDYNVKQTLKCFERIVK